ncbi:hypothetical protein [Macrococcus equipercicus]|uniref:hypothetical protein n=1 Tax=Macrococcus equipercicus TaxID=69967 RepID=UPI0014786E40|nr:hypothetical protein [Macrococcus equipercicus]
MKEYKKKHIIKHALEYYIKRSGASEKDLNQEKNVLEEVKEDIQQMKERYNIK